MISELNGETILQIIPAVGWRANVADPDCEPCLEDVACFALVQLPDGNRGVRAMIPCVEGRISDLVPFVDISSGGELFGPSSQEPPR